MIIQANSKLVMIGDSITDCGRDRPVGQGHQGELGTGYVSLVDGFLNTSYPNSHIQTINMGISGDTSRDLEARWQKDLMDLKPDWVSILIGINDIWRKLDQPDNLEIHIPIEEYEAALDRMVGQAKSAGMKLVLMTPFLMENDKNDYMRQEAVEYGRVCKKIAHKYQVIFVDLQAESDEFLDVNSGSLLSEDRVHPNLAGHAIIAKAFLKAIQFQW